MQNKNFLALGRLKAGSMNKTESAFAAYLDRPKLAGEILWYKFDAVNLRLAGKCFYKPDFLVLNKDSELIVYEVKGFWTDDAKAKTKIAAEMYPFRFVAVYKQSGRGEPWKFEEVG